MYILRYHEKIFKRLVTITINTAQITTIGVYTFANLVKNRTVVGLLAAACSTDWITLDIIESSSKRFTCKITCPDKFTAPANTVSPFCTCTGTDSPVIIDISNWVSPSIKVASSGTLSPTFTMILSLIFTFFKYSSLL